MKTVEELEAMLDELLKELPEDKKGLINLEATAKAMRRAECWGLK